ncbi:MAG: hypothetical protein HYX79_01810 [Chloroflexi bacterium]|nr:hypothetical protein [Chloroflexota bacterium]
MVEFSLDPVRYITRVWTMGKLGRILVIACLVVTAIAIFVGFSISLNGFGLAAVWVIPIGFWIWLGVLSESARMKIIWHYSSRSLGRKEIGDLPNHVGGMFFEFRITARNIGGQSLSLEPRMILHEVKTGRIISEVHMMENCPLSSSIVDKRLSAVPEFGQRPPHCPSPLSLKPNETAKFHLEFVVDKFSAQNIGLSRVAQAYYSLKFVDIVHGAFVFENNRSGVIKYKHLRPHQSFRF